MKERNLWDEIKLNFKIALPFGIIAMIIDTFIPLTFLAFMGFVVGPSMIVKTIIRFKRGDYKRYE